MKLTERSDAELSRWIAEKLEPLNSLPFHDEYSDRLERRGGCHPLGAPRCWQWQPLAKQFWQPRDMVNDPSMTVMLLEKLLVLDTVSITKAPNGPCYMIASEKPQEVKPSLGRAIAEAYALAHGFTEE